LEVPGVTEVRVKEEVRLFGRFSGGARTAAGLLGTRIAAGARFEERPEGGDRKPPDWLSELDDHDGVDGFELAMYSELGEVLAARIGRPSAADACRRAGSAIPERRPGCPRTRR
jgi:hypothetical protein